MASGYSLKTIRENQDADSSNIGVQLGRVCIERNIPVLSVSYQLLVTRQTVYNWFVGSKKPSARLEPAIRAYLTELG